MLSDGITIFIYHIESHNIILSVEDILSSYPHFTTQQWSKCIHVTFETLALSITITLAPASNNNSSGPSQHGHSRVSGDATACHSCRYYSFYEELANAIVPDECTWYLEEESGEGNEGTAGGNSELQADDGRRDNGGNKVWIHMHIYILVLIYTNTAI